WTSMPATVHQLSFAGGTLLINIIICIIIMQMRKEYAAKMKGRPEQGLLLSSFISLLMHLANDILLTLISITRIGTLSYFIALTIAIATTLPFWTMMTFAHSMR
ncbi:hypothetical protein PFISCL1PPCAC_5285, partial [Pristionchus fissidentatus]